jgi:hypothetical protein
MRFTYSSGQRVLNAYTIKRGIGRGGFGEVYYAISDGGKEVALKLVRDNNLDVEWRGMAQCLNLKHPNLLALYDLRTDSQGDQWVVMEYIGGESLSAVLGRHPKGLPQDLIRPWFTGLLKAVGYLHDHGIVHRDLKPGNIFIEQGTVKVGDYGLCKFISSTQHTAQTQSVGTVHYMAPEISTGNYNKQVDIYAAGVILYEMLTGRVPFDGESAGEILMKHLTSAPDLSPLPGDWVPVVARALAKNPAHRFGGVGEMVRAVEAVGGERRVVESKAAPAPAAPPAVHPRRQREPDEHIPSVIPVEPVRVLVGELCGSLALTTVFAGLAATLWAALAQLDDLTEVGTAFFLTVAICWAVLIPAKIWNYQPGDTGLRRAVMLILGLFIGLGALWLDGWTADMPSWSSWSIDSDSDSDTRAIAWNNAARGSDGEDWSPFLIVRQRQGLPVLAGYLSYFGIAFFALRWWKLADRRRPQRFSFAPVLAAGFWAMVLVVCPWPHVPQGALALVLAAVIVQLVSPWEQPPPHLHRRMRLRCS